jgi:translation machinery-associated protein 16
MPPSQTAKSTASKVKKEKLFHPSSRKAGQLARKSLRNGKLGNQSSKRSQKHNAQGKCRRARPACALLDLHISVDVYGFFFHALPEEGVLPLEELHGLIRDVWLARHDEQLEQEKASRRKGRPKSLKESKLEDIKLIEAEEYRTGIGMIIIPFAIHTVLRDCSRDYRSDAPCQC